MEILVFIPIWVGLAIAVSSYAKNRGLDRGVYLLISLLLSPLLGFIFAALAKPNMARAEAVALASGSTKKCPYCAELVKREAIVCRFCGRDLPVPENLPVTEKKISTVKPGDEIYYSEGGRARDVGWFVKPPNDSPLLGPFSTREEAETAKRGEPPTPEAPILEPRSGSAAETVYDANGWPYIVRNGAPAAWLIYRDPQGRPYIVNRNGVSVWVLDVRNDGTPLGQLILRP